MTIRQTVKKVTIAVGLSSKILPHNFNELCDASISYLRGEEFQLYPDFQTGGSIDAVSYTHLDVYKRQVKRFTGGRERCGHRYFR